ncbi:MAG: VWA domain-containing protein [Planctomycetes bacterium]|nr:VWA domain-containing protein [Planctomycetota bacterium]
MSSGSAALDRRLPVYLLLDCSGSMAGDPIAALEVGLKTLLADLLDDPQAMDTVWLSVVTFDSMADQVVPLMDISEFRTPHLAASGATALGEAFELLSERIHDEVRKTTEEQKGDWKPIVFVFTDGEPNDGWEESIAEFRSQHSAEIIACGAGAEVDRNTLKRIGDQVVFLKDTAPGTLGAFMKWVTETIGAKSKSVGTGGNVKAPVPEDQRIVVVQ